MTAKFDIKKSAKAVYSPTQTDWHAVDVPPMTFLQIDGEGDPSSSPRYAAAVEALYALSYAIKFASKIDRDRDYVVGPLEGLWWSTDRSAFVRGARDEWLWTLQIWQPDWITEADVASARLKAATKAPAAADVRFSTIAEGPSLQLLHIGPYSEEAPKLARLHDEVMPSLGLTFGAPHHEIYLSDPRRVEPERLRTIVRQPVVPAA